jgi:UDP-3-O-[3-hydroxymyristoyl] glucosamine N-acyltransferase
MSSERLDSFHICFNGKNYSVWEFQFQLFVKGKELWGHINGSNPAPNDVDALSKWEIMDAPVISWILSLREPHLVLNLRPYKTAATMWNYLNKVYNQDNTARRFQLEYEMANFTQGSLSIEEYFSGFQNLWTNYSDIVYANVPAAALFAVQAVHETRKRDQFLMKLCSDFETARSNLMNRHPVPSLDACLSELLREEQHIVTQAAMEHRVNVIAPVSVAYGAQGRNKGRDMHVVQCFSCKAFGHIARDYPKKFCNYCKKQGHIISTCPIRPESKQGTAYHISIGASSSAVLPTASPVVPIANPNTLTPEMVQQMIISVNTQRKIYIYIFRERGMMMNAVFPADAGIGSDAVFAADAEIGSDAVFAADAEIGSDAVFTADSGLGSDAVFAADAEISSDAVFAADSGLGSDAVFAADSGLGSDAVFAADAEIGSDAVFAADTEIGSDAVFAADFSMHSDAELGGRGKTGFR